MPQRRKYSTKDSPVVGAVIDWLGAMESILRRAGMATAADKCRQNADGLYDYLARNLHRRGAARTEAERKARNQSILLRGYQKRIAELEEKLLLIRTSTDLHERGVLTSGLPGGGGERIRMKRRIDHLEAKLLIIRELSDTTVGKSGRAAVPEKERQIHDARIRVDVEKGLRGRTHKVNPDKVALLENAVRLEARENQEKGE